MKARFITNAVLSALSLIGFVLLIAGIATPLKEVYNNPYSYSYSYSVDTLYSSNLSSLRALIIAGSAFMGLFGFASLVMGIITLAMIGTANQRGLGIASGVLAILGGVLGANAIVSTIGAIKE